MRMQVPRPYRKTEDGTLVAPIVMNETEQTADQPALIH